MLTVAVAVRSLHEEASARLGRELHPSEHVIRLAENDRTLENAKARLAAAIDVEKRRAIREYLDGRGPGQLRLTDPMLRVLVELRDAGRDAARQEMVDLGVVARRFASLPEIIDTDPDLYELRARLNQHLYTMSRRVEKEAVRADFGTLAAASVFRRVEQRVPGALNAAADLVSRGFGAGLGDVFGAAADLFDGWLYTAIMDGGTCSVCRALDGTRYDSWQAIQAVLPDGGPNPSCHGRGRCRCRPVPIIDGDPPTGLAPDDGVPPELRPQVAASSDAIASVIHNPGAVRVTVGGARENAVFDPSLGYMRVGDLALANTPELVVREYGRYLAQQLDTEDLLAAIRATPTTQKVLAGGVHDSELLISIYTEDAQLVAHAVRQYVAEYGNNEALRGWLRNVQDMATQPLSPGGFQVWQRAEFDAVARALEDALDKAGMLVARHAPPPPPMTAHVKTLLRGASPEVRAQLVADIATGFDGVEGDLQGVIMRKLILDGDNVAVTVARDAEGKVIGASASTAEGDGFIEIVTTATTHAGNDAVERMLLHNTREAVARDRAIAVGANSPEAAFVQGLPVVEDGFGRVALTKGGTRRLLARLQGDVDPDPFGIFDLDATELQDALYNRTNRISGLKTRLKKAGGADDVIEGQLAELQAESDAIKEELKRRGVPYTRKRETAKKAQPVAAPSGPSVFGDQQPGFTTIEQARQDAELQGVRGAHVLFDEGAIEDLDVRVTPVKLDGANATEYRFKLAGDRLQQLHLGGRWKREGMVIPRKYVDDAGRAAIDLTTAAFDASMAYGSQGTAMFTLKGAWGEVRVYRGAKGSGGWALDGQVAAWLKDGVDHAAVWREILDELGVLAQTYPSPDVVRRVALRKAIATLDPEGGPVADHMVEDRWRAVKTRFGLRDDPSLEIGHDGRASYVLSERDGAHLAKRSGVAAFKHNVSHGDAETLAQMLANPRGLMSTTQRFQEGVGKAGMSSETDIQTGGAEYVFTRHIDVRKARYLSGTTFVYDSSPLMRRLDWFAYGGDNYGRTNDDSYLRRRSPIDEVADSKGRGGQESMFKHSLDPAALRYVVVPDRTRKADVLAALKRRGVTSIGGRRAEDVVVVSGDYRWPT